MTSPFITEEAVKAAAEAFYGKHRLRFDNETDMIRALFSDYMTTALLAALPHIEKAIKESCAAIADEYEARWRMEAGERDTSSQTYAHARADASQSIAATIRARKE